MKQQSDIIKLMNITSMNWKVRLFIFFSILVGLGVTIYGKPLYELGSAVLQRYGSSHGLFVPFISGYLFLLKIDEIKKLKPTPAVLLGSAMTAIGLVFLAVSRNSEGIGIQVLSFLVIASGLILILFGNEVFKAVGFPLFFLATMIPIPDAVYSQVSEWMRQTTTWGAVALMKPLGFPIHRDGFDIYLPNIYLYVDHSCSGIRYLLSYLVFGVAYAFRFKPSIKAQALVIIGAVPLSIVGGVLRLGIIFSSAYYIGPLLTKGRPHILFSWSVFTVLLVGAIAIDRYLTGYRGRRSGGRERPTV